MLDAVHTNIAMYFNGAANYIDDALKQGGKRVVLEYIIYLDPEIKLHQFTAFAYLNRFPILYIQERFWSTV